MRVICIDNTGAALPEGLYTYTKNSKFQITIGKEYRVYGIVTFKGFPWYLICEDHFDGVYINYPVYIFFRCFKISSGRLSSFWEVVEDNDFYSYNERVIKFGFKELVSEKGFHSNLLEGDEREVNIFRVIKKAIDNEF